MATKSMARLQNVRPKRTASRTQAVLSLKDVNKMASFVSRVVQHMGGASLRPDSCELANLANLARLCGR